MKKYLIIPFFFSLWLISAPNSLAATGCCQISTPSNSNGYFETITREECRQKNLTYAGANFKFEENKKAAANAKGCEDINTTSSNNTKAELKPSKISDPIANPKLSVSIPGFLGFQPPKCDAESCTSNWIAQYIAALYYYGIGSITILAVIVLMIAGIMWLTSAGNSSKVEEAKKLMQGSIFGIVIAMSAYMILTIVNTNLTTLQPVDISYIDKIDLPEVQVDTVELNKNIQETISSGKIAIGKYCGCFDYRNSKTTTKLNTAEAINDAISYLQSNSPLKNKGQIILNAANKYGFDPAILIAKAKQENALGTADSTQVKSMKNLASISCKDGAGAGDVSQTPGCKAFTCALAKNGRPWRSYPTWEDSIDDYFCFLKNSPQMGGSASLRELVTRYCPPCLYKGKCDCNTSQYIDNVASTMQKYNSNSWSSDTPNNSGTNCGCYNMVKHCSDHKTTYCTDYK